MLKYWDNLWKKDNYYASYDIPSNTDGIYYLLKGAVKEYSTEKTLLEVGSGPATRSIPFAKSTGLQLHLLDPLESAHELAKKRAARYGMTCTNIVGSVLDIPTKDNVYDYVVSIGLNEHFLNEDRKKCFSEMYRVTKENGTCVVIVPNLWGSINIEKFLKEKNNTWKFGVTKFFNIFELRNMMKECGFKKVNIYGVSYFSGIVRVLPVDVQRKIFKSKAWEIITRFPFNLNINFFVNKLFGEEIMAVGEK